VLVSVIGVAVVVLKRWRFNEMLILEIKKLKDITTKKYVGSYLMRGDTCIGEVISETDDIFKVRVDDEDAYYLDMLIYGECWFSLEEKENKNEKL
jgi:hypothetical protein